MIRRVNRKVVWLALFLALSLAASGPVLAEEQPAGPNPAGESQANETEELVVNAPAAEDILEATAPASGAAGEQPAPVDGVEVDDERQEPEFKTMVVGGVTLEFPSVDGFRTRRLRFPVRIVSAPEGAVVNIGVHRPGSRRGLGYILRPGQDQALLSLLPGINVVTVSTGNEVRRVRMVAVPPGYRLKHFKDLATRAGKHWASQQVERLQSMGVFSGWLGDEFQPDEPATRSDVAIFIDRMVNLSIDVGAGLPALPVDVRNPGVGPAVQRLMKAGVMQGVGGNRFDPGGKLTRAQIAVILDRILPDKPAAADVLKEFPDGRRIPEWARAAVGKMRARGLISGYEDRTFRPDRPVTRAELATMLDRFVNYQARLWSEKKQ